MKTLKELLKYHPKNTIKTPYIGQALFIAVQFFIYFAPQLIG